MRRTLILIAALLALGCEQKREYHEGEIIGWGSGWTREQVDAYCDTLEEQHPDAYEMYSKLWATNRVSEMPVLIGCVYERGTR